MVMIFLVLYAFNCLIDFCLLIYLIERFSYLDFLFILAKNMFVAGVLIS